MEEAYARHAPWDHHGTCERLMNRGQSKSTLMVGHFPYYPSPHEHKYQHQSQHQIRRLIWGPPGPARSLAYAAVLVATTICRNTARYVSMSAGPKVPSIAGLSLFREGGDEEEGEVEDGEGVEGLGRAKDADCVALITFSGSCIESVSPCR